MLFTGANQDGAKGLQKIQEAGGLAVVQDPATAQLSTMPEAGRVALAAAPEQILSLSEIADLLIEISEKMAS